MAVRTRHCPRCGGQIHAIASRCKHCKAELVAPPAAAQSDVARPQPVTTRSPPPGHAALPAASAWSRRWPLIAVALALLVIGASVGVLVERWLRSQDSGELRRGTPGNRPREVPDRMPQPGLPGLR
jgi:hypothetical protein